jgi:TPR repeat protein
MIYPMSHSKLRRRVFSLPLIGSLLAISLVAADSSEITSLRAKAERGNAIAQYNLGLAYATGRETTRDLAEAYVWLTLAEENGTTGKAVRTLLADMSSAELAEGQRRLELRRSQSQRPGRTVTTTASAVTARTQSTTSTSGPTIGAGTGPAPTDTARTAPRAPRK